MLIKPHWLKEILREVSEETGVPEEEVTRIWAFTEDQIGRYMRMPTAPNIMVNGFFRFKPDRKKVDKRIFHIIHKIRNAKGVPKKQVADLVHLLKIRSRILHEEK